MELGDAVRPLPNEALVSQRSRWSPGPAYLIQAGFSRAYPASQFSAWCASLLKIWDLVGFRASQIRFEAVKCPIPFG